MTRASVQRALLLALYGVVLLLPLVLIAGVAKPGAQGRLVVFADALGFAGLSLLALQILVSGRWALATRRFGLRSVLSLHRHAGMALLALVVAHVVLLMVDNPARLALLDTPAAPPRAQAGMLALLGLVGLALTTIRRRRLGLDYERWRALHLALTALVVIAAFAHVVWVDAYTSIPAVRWTILALVLAAAAAFFWTRIARPYATALRPYRVLGVRRERGNAVTLDLVAEGHRGVSFEPGQFAWLRAPHCLYGMNDHPFSLSSSAHTPDRPSFTVKALGDFSSSLGDLRAGTQLLLDGPHGEGTHLSPAVRGRLLLASGIGITPALSVIRTAAAAGEARPLLLLYGSRCWADVTFREELGDLERALPNLRVVHVLSRPDETWRGERGRLSVEVLRRHSPPLLTGWTALVCGPAAMVGGLARGLRTLGMAQAAIQAEGFD